MTAKITKGLYSFVMVFYFIFLSLLGAGDYLYPDKAGLFTGQELESRLCFSCREEETGTGKVLAFGILPVKSVSVEYYEDHPVLCGGQLFGLRLETGGLLITGMAPIPVGEGERYPGKDAGLQTGDLLLRADGVELKSAAAFQKILAKNEGNRMRLDLERAQEKIRFMLKNGLRVSLFFMYGFPEETEADLNDTLELMFTLVDMGVQSIIMAYTRFNPATQIAEDHMDELILDPKIKVLTRAVFGYEEEKMHIEQHKTVFPFFYHLSTPVRENFQYVIFFTHVYRQFPNAARYLRKLYEGDNLRFYRDFCEVNESCFAEDMDHATREVVDNPLELMENMLQKFDGEWVEQLRGLMRYDWDQHRVSKSKEDISLQETYDFVIMDLQRRRPIQQFAKGKTTLVMEKKNGIARVKILDVR